MSVCLCVKYMRISRAETDHPNLSMSGCIRILKWCISISTQLETMTHTLRLRCGQDLYANVDHIVTMSHNSTYGVRRAYVHWRSQYVLVLTLITLSKRFGYWPIGLLNVHDSWPWHDMTLSRLWCHTLTINQKWVV